MKLMQHSSLKKYLTLGVFFLLFSPLFSVTQFLLPKNVSVGDTVELHYMFQSEANLFWEEEQAKNSDESDIQKTEEVESSARLSKSGALDLRTDISAFKALSDKCFVQKAVLEHVDAEYTLILTLVVWKVGEIDFPPFNLISTLFHYESGGEIMIDLEPFTVLSVVERTGAQSLKPPAPPLIVPGTTFYLVLFAILFVIFVTALIILLTKIPAISSFLHDSKSVRQAKRYARRAIKKLRILDANNKKMEMLDKEFCAEVQKILRSYLQHRFRLPFKNMSTSELPQAFEDLFDGDIPGEKESAIEELSALFTRTDFLRYSENAGAVGSVEGLVDKAIQVVNAFDVHTEEEETNHAGL